MKFPKYSYMPCSGFNIGSGYFDSEHRTMRFRNQYGETFVFGPVRAVNITFGFMFTFGCIIGFTLGKVL